MAAETVRFDENIDLHYSPDDAGWYAQDYGLGRGTSAKVYEHRGQLIADLTSGRHEWADR